MTPCDMCTATCRYQMSIFSQAHLEMRAALRTGSNADLNVFVFSFQDGGIIGCARLLTAVVWPNINAEQIAGMLPRTATNRSRCSLPAERGTCVPACASAAAPLCPRPACHIQRTYCASADRSSEGPLNVWCSQGVDQPMGCPAVRA